MSLMLQKLNNIRSLRTITREFSIDALDDILEKLRIVTEEKRTQQQAEHAQKAEYQEKISTWLELMMADGITPDSCAVSASPDHWRHLHAFGCDGSRIT